jgi:hypothetical protein
VHGSRAVLSGLTAAFVAIVAVTAWLLWPAPDESSDAAPLAALVVPSQWRLEHTDHRRPGGLWSSTTRETWQADYLAPSTLAATGPTDAAGATGATGAPDTASATGAPDTTGATNPTGTTGAAEAVEAARTAAAAAIRDAGWQPCPGEESCWTRPGYRLGVTVAAVADLGDGAGPRVRISLTVTADP